MCQNKNKGHNGQFLVVCSNAHLQLLLLLMLLVLCIHLSVGFLCVLSVLQRGHMECLQAEMHPEVWLRSAWRRRPWKMNLTTCPTWMPCSLRASLSGKLSSPVSRYVTVSDFHNRLIVVINISVIWFPFYVCLVKHFIIAHFHKCHINKLYFYYLLLFGWVTEVLVPVSSTNVMHFDIHIFIIPGYFLLSLLIIATALSSLLLNILGG